jgi:UDP-N-acetylglucosamine--N-acetylmuramyl-(pentapeptide) pyrophosphoryl-undecaprenol N-acetylglucosamine transferase
MTALFVSTLGGHLNQLVQLVPRLQGIDTTRRLWITHDDPQSRSLLAGEEVIFVPYVRERDLAGVARSLPHALRIIRSRDVTSVVSTGSALATGYLTAARLCRRPAYFIESAAFQTGHTLTGRMLRYLPGAKVLTQSPLAAGDGFRYCGGSVLDGYIAEPPITSPSPTRIVVTVGTSHEYNFRRLFERLVTIVPPGVDVTWQTGGTDVAGLDIVPTPWMPAADLSMAMAEADLVIAHAGAGSVLTALGVGKRPVLVPRRLAYREAGSDHQTQIAAHLVERGLAASREVETLEWADLVAATGWTVRALEAPPVIDLRAA